MKPIISKNIRVRRPEDFAVGDDSVIDDYSYFSTKVKIGKHCHIGNNCSIAGGRDMLFELGDYSSLSAGVRVWCRSNDYVNGLISIDAPDDGQIKGDVIIGKYCGVGANSVIMPDNAIPEGVAIGALSYVPQRFRFKEWSVYAGIPIKLIKPRNKKRAMDALCGD